MSEAMSCRWIFTTKILNHIQMEILLREDYSETGNMASFGDVLQALILITVTFYCMSTESRFIERQNNKPENGKVLESESWLSRSLEMAYTFLPLEAPIFAQIYSVHEKFYGLGNQPIPEDA